MARTIHVAVSGFPGTVYRDILGDVLVRAMAASATSDTIYNSSISRPAN
ncbi:hypothetical protein [Mycobacterium lepromatosis]|nr:hypothetical protein [Mycobacterium lepromatosis]